VVVLFSLLDFELFWQCGNMFVFLLDFRTVLTVWYFCFSFSFYDFLIKQNYHTVWTVSKSNRKTIDTEVTPVPLHTNTWPLTFLSDYPFGIFFFPLFTWVDISPTCGKHVHDHTIPLRGSICLHKTSWPHHILLNCIEQVRKVSGHVFVCKGTGVTSVSMVFLGQIT
jgi:hypothetical protein